MISLSPYAILTDDPQFACAISALLATPSTYLPVISLPRLVRNDWHFEVAKRAISINRQSISRVFVRAEDYACIAPLRDRVNSQIIPLESPVDLQKYLDIPSDKQTTNCHSKQFREGLIRALMNRCQIEFSNEGLESSLSQEISRGSDTIVVVERTNLITDVVAINYAYASNYDLRFVKGTEDHHQKWALQERFNELCVSIGIKEGSASVELADLHDLIIETLDYPAIEKKYKKVLVIFQAIPFGLLLEHIPCAHMFHLQSDLRLLESVTNSAEKRQITRSKPIYFFVDSTDGTLISEIPTIQNLIKNQSHLEFHIRGKDATVGSFRRYLEFLPFDILFVAGHGGAPKCRDVTYLFKDRRCISHSMRVLEYYQIDIKERIGEEIPVQVHLEFLAIDGIPYSESEMVSSMGLDHLKLDFTQTEQRDLKVMTQIDIDPETILGIKLADGVFFNDVRSYAETNNPIIILNTCGSLLEASQMLSYAGARCLIGTMWNITDSSAVSFAKELFLKGENMDLLSAFHSARQSLSGSRSATSYIYFGGLTDFFPMGPDDESKAEKAFINRMATGIIKAQTYVEHKLIREEELKRFATFRGLFGSAVDQLNRLQNEEQ